MQVKVKVSAKGSDVSSDNLVFSSDKRYLKLSGPYTQTINISNSLSPGSFTKKETFAHNLGYAPMMIVILDFSDAEVSYDFPGPYVTWYPSEMSYCVLPFFQHMVGLFEVSADTTNFYIVGDVDNYRNVKMSYYIVEETI